jgi:hypothetical protein
MARIAERTKNVAMAQEAVLQLELAFKALLAGGHGPNADYFEKRLSYARLLHARLLANVLKASEPRTGP